MIAIFYINNQDFFCENIPDVSVKALINAKRIRLESCLHLRIKSREIYCKKILAIYCEMLPQETDAKFDICNREDYPIMGENVKPIYIHNNPERISFWISNSC